MTRHSANATHFLSWLNLQSVAVGADYFIYWTPPAGAPIDATLLDAIKAYFESAHRDAKEHFTKVCRLSLHPVASAATPVDYPRCLPDNARKANFGEVMCGAIIESHQMFGANKVVVPVFLLRADENVRNYLMRLREGGPTTSIPGRQGDDFIGLECGSDGSLQGVVVGEAKFRGNLSQAEYDALMLGTSKTVPPKSGNSTATPPKVVTTKGVLEKLSKEPELPVSLFQMADILAEISPDDFEDILVSIDEIATGKRVVPRRDLVLLVMSTRAVNTPAPYSSLTKRGHQYNSKRSLAIIEVHIPDAQTWVDALYDSLYSVP